MIAFFFCSTALDCPKKMGRVHSNQAIINLIVLLVVICPAHEFIIHQYGFVTPVVDVTEQTAEPRQHLTVTHPSHGNGSLACDRHGRDGSGTGGSLHKRLEFAGCHEWLDLGLFPLVFVAQEGDIGHVVHRVNWLLLFLLTVSNTNIKKNQHAIQRSKCRFAFSARFGSIQVNAMRSPVFEAHGQETS